MKEIILEPKKKSIIPIEAEVISPDVITQNNLKEISDLEVFVGNTKDPLSAWFKIKGEVADDPSQQLITVDGNVPHVKYIGAKMTVGKIVVKGDAGMHSGSQMRGGELIIEGSADDWTGAEMSGGLLVIKGDAGHLLGSAYRGSADGMKGGCIHVMGNAGTEAASFMRRGMIIVEGNTGPFTGVHMNGGEIIVFGTTGRRAGAQAKGNGGFIACLGGVETMLPTYRFDTSYTPVFWRLYLLQLSDKLDILRAKKYIDTPLRRYRGDLAVGGNAEILIAEP